MSTKIGALKIDLGVNSAAFEKGITGAERRLSAFGKTMGRIGKQFSSFGRSLSVSVTAPILAAGAAFGASAHKMAKDARELGTAADIAGEGFENFQRQAFAASSVGIEFAKLGDQFKDVRERVGEFIVTGSGPLQDAFDALNGKVRLTVDELRGLSGKDALQLIVSRMEEAELSTEEMSFVLESLASDTTQLLPLLRDGGKAFEELGKKAAIISPEDRANFEKYTQAQAQLGEATKKLTIALVSSGILETVTNLVERFADFTSNLAETNPGLLKLGIAVAGVAAAIGPLMVGLGGMMQFIGPLLGAKGLAGLAAAAGPVGIAIGAVAAAGVLVYKNWDKIAPVLQRVGERINEVLGPPLKELIASISTNLTKLWEGPFGDGLRTVIDWLGKFQSAYLGTLGEALLRILSGAVSAVQTGFEIMANTFDALAKLLSGDFSGAWRAAYAVIDSGIRGVLRTVEAVFPEINGYLSGLYTAAKQWLQDKLGAVFDWVNGKVLEVQNTFKDLYIAVVGNSYIPDLVEGVRGEFAKLDEVMVNPARRAAAATSAAFAGITGPSIGRVGAISQDPGTPAVDMGGGDPTTAMLGRWSEVIQTVGQSFGGVAQSIANLMQTLINPALQTGIDQTNQLGAAMQSLTSLFQDLFGKKAGGIIGGLFNAGLQIASAFSGGPAIPRYAQGTNFHPGGLAITGEQGPELVNLPRGAQVMSNRSLREANSGGGNLKVEVVANNNGFGAIVRDHAGRVVAEAAPSIMQGGAQMAQAQAARSGRRSIRR